MQKSANYDRRLFDKTNNGQKFVCSFANLVNDEASRGALPYWVNSLVTNDK